MKSHSRIVLICCLLISTLTAPILVATNVNTLTTQTTITKKSNELSTTTKQNLAKTVYKTSNTAIVFDVDDVIVKRTIPIFSLAWQYKVEILKALFNFSLLKDVFILIRMTTPVGVYISLFERKQPGLVPFARELITTRTTDPKTVCIIESLLALGYKLHIGTNETASEFILHQERFSVFSRFATYTFADYSTFPDVTQKPQLRYFERMKDRILAHNKKTTHFIFIDDRTDNVQASRSTGYLGIDFTTPETLEATLVDMGIMPPSCTKILLIPAVAL